MVLALVGFASFSHVFFLGECSAAKRGWTFAQEVLNTLVVNWWKLCQLCLYISEEVLWLVPSPAHDRVVLKEEENAGSRLSEPCLGLSGE